jgi:hypothetical protein
MKTLVQPSSFISVASAAPWMVSLGTIRTYVRARAG